MRLTGRMGRNGRTAVPREVRERLGLAPGDSLVYEVEGETVRLRRLAPADLAYLRTVQSTLSEWDSPEDDAAYAGL